MLRKTHKRELKIINQENGAVVFDKNQGIYFQTNEVGVRILELLSENKTETEIVKHLADEYSVEYSIIEKDVKDFMQSLNKGGI